MAKALRYVGDATKIRLGGVYVRADGVDQGRLGVVVLPVALDIDGAAWVGVYDSAHDAQGWLNDLATALHAYLAVPPFAFYPGRKTRLVSHGESRYVGVARKSTSTWEKTLHAVGGGPRWAVRVGSVGDDSPRRRPEHCRKLKVAVPPTLIAR